MEKIKLADFVRQIAKESGYAQRDIREVLKTASNVVAKNIANDTETVVMDGVVIYTSHYPARDATSLDGKKVHYDEVIYPRARFTQGFKDKLLS